MSKEDDDQVLMPHSALEFACPTCKVKPFNQCVKKNGGELSIPHPARMKLLEKS